MPEPKDGRPLTKPNVNGIPAPAGAVRAVDSPHIEMLARLGVGGGVLTSLETREVCASVVAHIEAARRLSPDRASREPSDMEQAGLERASLERTNG